MSWSAILNSHECENAVVDQKKSVITIKKLKMYIV